MILVETSALIAIVSAEPGYERLLELVLEDGAPKVAAHGLLEAHIVLSTRFAPAMLATFDGFVRSAELVVLPFAAEHADAARAAFTRFGKGRHPAALNFGDCMSYAVAKVGGMPLLFVGGDFGLTDVVGP